MLWSWLERAVIWLAVFVAMDQATKGFYGPEIISAATTHVVVVASWAFQAKACLVQNL